MKKKKFGYGMSLLVLALGVTGIVLNGCSENVDRSLNGTWKAGDGIMKFNSGNYEFTSEEGSPLSQGTYTTSDGKLIRTVSHYYGTVLRLEPRWYSRDELIEKGIIRNNTESTFTFGYTINGNILTVIYDNSNTETLTLISRNGKFTLADSGNEKSKKAGKSSGRVSAFPGRWQLIEGYGDAKNVELFKDGTGTADGYGITWKIENGRFHILHPWYTFSAIYNVTGSTITFTQENGTVLKYKKIK